MKTAHDAFAWQRRGPVLPIPTTRQLVTEDERARYLLQVADARKALYVLAEMKGFVPADRAQ